MAGVFPYDPTVPLANLGGSASLLQAVLGEPGSPAGWMPSSVEQGLASLDLLLGPERNTAARRLADQLVSGEVPIAALGYSVRDDFLAASLDCDAYPPFSYGVDLAALCPTGA